MRRVKLLAFLISAFALALSMPVQAASTTSTAKKSSTSASTDSSSASSSSSSSSTTSAAPAKPVSKQIDVEKISSSGISSKGVLDVYFTATNKGKYDDAITGVESSVSDKVVLIGMVTPPPAPPPPAAPPAPTNGKDAKSGKSATPAAAPTPAPAPTPKQGEVPKIDLPKDKAVTLAEGEQFVHITGVEKAPKDGGPAQVTLHFRSAPNVIIDVPLKSSSAW